MGDKGLQGRGSHSSPELGDKSTHRETNVKITLMQGRGGYSSLELGDKRAGLQGNKKGDKCKGLQGRGGHSSQS